MAICGRPVDLLFDGTEAITYGKKRIERNVHGTGCMFSSALLALLALGYPVKEAFLETERIVERLIDESVQPAAGGYFYAFPGSRCSHGRPKEGRFSGHARCRLPVSKEPNMADSVPGPA